MRTLIAIAISAVFIFSACKREELEPASTASDNVVLKERPNPMAVPQDVALTQSELDDVVLRTLEGRDDFHWEWVDLRTLWSATLYSDHSLPSATSRREWATSEDDPHDRYQQGRMACGA